MSMKILILAVWVFGISMIITGWNDIVYMRISAVVFFVVMVASQIAVGILMKFAGTREMNNE